jgi:hypothetical protein
VITDNITTLNAITGNINTGLFTNLSVLSSSLALCNQAGSLSQQSNAIAIGNQAGQSYQQINGIAIGYQSGNYSQLNNAIALGYQSGYLNQGNSSIAIGFQAGYSNLGNNSIAIGNGAGYSNLASNAIVLNATGSLLNSTNSGLYIAPIRQTTITDLQSNTYYNSGTNELTYNSISIPRVKKTLLLNSVPGPSSPATDDITQWRGVYTSSSTNNQIGVIATFNCYSPTAAKKISYSLKINTNTVLTMNYYFNDNNKQYTMPVLSFYTNLSSATNTFLINLSSASASDNSFCSMTIEEY